MAENIGSTSEGIVIAEESSDLVETDVEKKTELTEVQNSEPNMVDSIECKGEEEDARAAEGDNAGTEDIELQSEDVGVEAEASETNVAGDELGEEGFLVLEEDDNNEVEDLVDSNDINGLNEDYSEQAEDETFEEKVEDNVTETDEHAVPDSSNDCCDHASENVMLRKAILELSERLSVLEEFLETEEDERFGKFMKNRERLVNVMGLGDPQDVTTTPIDGKRNSKSTELIGLLKVIKAQTSTNNSDKTRGTRIPTSTSSRHPKKEESSLSSTAPAAGSRRNRDSKTGPSKSNSRRSNRTSGGGGIPSSSTTSINKNVRSCKCCFETDHLLAQCPYRGKRPFEIRKEIQKRKQTYYSAGKDSPVSKVRRT